MSAALKRKWRKIVTGDEQKRVRDHVQERRKQPFFVRLVDKVAFTLGVLNISLSQYFLLSKPSFLWVWYSIVIPILWALRAREFLRRKLSYFLYDFCYLVLGGTLLNIFMLPRSVKLFKILYIFSHGPLALAVVIWRCSLVFHDIEKITSVYIHILPAMLYYTLRWETSSLFEFQNNSVCAVENVLLPEDYFLAIVIYSLWQGVYYMKTEVFDRWKLDSDQEYITSLRWMARDNKHMPAIIVLKLLRYIGIFGQEETFEASSTKTKFTFMFTQLVYTASSLLISHRTYNSKMENLAYIITLFVIAVYFGASYYIDVFSNFYQMKFKTSPESVQRPTPTTCSSSTS